MVYTREYAYTKSWGSAKNECCAGCNTSNNPVYTNQEVSEKHALMTGLIGTLLSTGMSALEYYGNKTVDKSRTPDIPESTTPDRTHSADVEETGVEILKTDAEIQEHVRQMLADKKITNLDDKMLNKLVTKYNELKDTYSEEMIALKLSNYVRGSVNAQKMSNWDKSTNVIIDNFMTKGIENPDVTKALRDTKGENDTINLEKDGSISIEKLSVLSNSYFEYNNQNGDEKIDLLEFFKANLVKHYQVFENLSMDDASEKVELKLAELGIKDEKDLFNLAGTIDINSENITEELMVLANSVKTFEKIDRTDDLGLDINEVKAYHAAMANFDTQDNMLDIADRYAFKEAILSGETMTVAGEKVEAVDYFLDGYYNALTKK